MSSDPVQYGKDVLSGKVDVCRYVKLSVERHFNDLEKQRTDDFPYYFDEEAGIKPVKFFQILRHWRGEFYDKPFIPEPWQAWVLYVFYGWKRVDDDKRRFKYLYIEVPRKNGKTTFMAACTLYHMLKDDENAPEVYFAATKQRQASLCLKEARKIGAQTPEVRKRIIIRAHSIEYPTKNGSMEALGSDSDKQHGLNPSMVILDEMHAHKTLGMYEVLDSAFGMRAQPTLMMITTAGADRSYPCYELRQSFIEILEGSKQQENSMSMIYTIDKDDDWKKEATWKKANPSWGIMYKPKFREDAEKAIKFSSHENSFKNLRLNIWTDAREVWMQSDLWMKHAIEPISDDRLVGLPCYGGADFAETLDLCALALNFRLDDGGTYLKFYFWIPEKKVLEKEDIVDYHIWRSQGHINVIQGDAIDHNQLAVEVLDILNMYRVEGVAYDKYGIGEAVIQSMITEHGYPTDKLHPVKQRTTFFQGPIVTLEERINTGLLKHDGNPVMEWNIRNTEVFYDTNGGKKFIKSKARNKIDGSVAMAMAIYEEVTSPPPDDGSFYVV